MVISHPSSCASRLSTLIPTWPRLVKVAGTAQLHSAFRGELFSFGYPYLPEGVEEQDPDFEPIALKQTPLPVRESQAVGLQTGK
jgi:hypothetical protein